VRLLYTLLLRLVLPLALARLWWRGRREGVYREHVGERFGHYEAEELLVAPKRLIWIHAVSVGEARAAAPLVRALKEAYPDHALLLTCMTAAGRETLRQVYGESVLRAWLPYDYPGAVQRFLEHFRPRLGVIMETEMWPNLLAACEATGLPMLLANARMSEKSARGYARWSAISRPAIRRLAGVCAQSAADAARLEALGARNVEVAGNLKFDVALDLALVERGREWRRRLGRPVLLLASTREGEEKLLLDALPPWDGKLLVLVVPRHPQRFDEVAQWAQARRSLNDAVEAGARIYLGDTMGEMAFYFAACDVALVGGSFGAHGGQNLIEGLAAGAPVVVGPHMFNFAEATRLAVAAGAALQARDAEDALRLAAGLLGDAARREAMSRAGSELCRTNRGATARHLEACARLLASAPLQE
jgi:3-deoxy-D-manno-octulosonic-acid transferase